MRIRSEGSAFVIADDGLEELVDTIVRGGGRKQPKNYLGLCIF
jgi:hypothetical protein